MLSEEALNKLSERITNRISNLNTYMIKKLAEQVKTIGKLTPSQLNEIYQSIKYGNDLDKIAKELAKVSELTVKDIYTIFEEVAKKNQVFAQKFYEYKNIPYIPYEKNKPLQDMVMAIARRTANEYVNISRTFAFMTLNSAGIIEYTPLSLIYQKITDEAVLATYTGRESFNMIMKRTMLTLSDKGMQTIDFASGYHRRADSSVRMNILEGVRTLQNEVNMKFGEEFGADGVEVVHHLNPAPDHSSDLHSGWHDIDGRQFSKEQFEEINSDLNRPVSELNCYHFIIPIVMGVSKPVYSEDQLKADKEANLKGFDFEGSHYTNYEGTQLQRQIETQIRRYKDKLNVAEELDLEEKAKYKIKIKQLTNKYKNLSKVSGLPTRMDRLRVYTTK